MSHLSTLACKKATVYFYFKLERLDYKYLIFSGLCILQKYSRF